MQRKTLRYAQKPDLIAFIKGNPTETVKLLRNISHLVSDINLFT